MAQVEGAGKPLTLQSGQTVQIRQNANGVVTGLTIDTGNRTAGAVYPPVERQLCACAIAEKTTASVTPPQMKGSKAKRRHKAGVLLPERQSKNYSATTLTTSLANTSL
jgi:hypothetical protein